jgi:glycosyltransferase involved in cell wall biosynthesis
MSDHENFAVIICAYSSDRWQRLLAAIHSVQNQSLPPREVVVVIDHNESLLLRAKETLQDIVVVPNRFEQGLRGARNSGVEAATAAQIAFMDDDAEAASNWLQSLSEPYEDPDVAGVGGLTEPLWDTARPAWFPHEFEWVVGGAYRGMSIARGDVRNLWGGNMSFRRKLVTEAGGFRIGYSCDDTELCIRLRQRWPQMRLVFVPEARVLHHVGSRMTVKHFMSRCYFEGGSKAVISRLVGSATALESERRYTTAILPRGFAQSIGDAVWRRDRAGVARAGLIVGGLAAAVTGYGVGLLTPRRAALKRGWDGDPMGGDRS